MKETVNATAIEIVTETETVTVTDILAEATTIRISSSAALPDSPTDRRQTTTVAPEISAEDSLAAAEAEAEEAFAALSTAHLITLPPVPEEYSLAMAEAEEEDSVRLVVVRHLEIPLGTDPWVVELEAR